MEEVVALRHQLAEAQAKLDTTVEFVHALCHKLGVIPDDLVEDEEVEQSSHKAAS